LIRTEVLASQRSPASFVSQSLLPGNTEAAKRWSAKLKNPKNPIKTENFYNTLVVLHERDVSTAIFRLQYEIMVHK
jgi:hypothetical protein